jgi:hypothetical protein
MKLLQNNNIRIPLSCDAAARPGRTESSNMTMQKPQNSISLCFIQFYGSQQYLHEPFLENLEHTNYT